MAALWPWKGNIRDILEKDDISILTQSTAAGQQKSTVYWKYVNIIIHYLIVAV